MRNNNNIGLSGQLLQTMRGILIAQAFDETSLMQQVVRVQIFAHAACVKPSASRLFLVRQL